MIKKKTSVQTLCLCAFFTALTAVMAHISIPVEPVPINFIHTSIFTSVALIGTKYGTLSQVAYILIGAAGVPVFTNFTAGLGILVGPRGGFFAGYIACAIISGLIINRFGNSVKVLIPAMYAGWAVTYLFGISWYIFLTNITLAAALPIVFFPFLIGDLIKTIAAVILIKRLTPVMVRIKK